MRPYAIALALLVAAFGSGCDLDALLDGIIINIQIDGLDPNVIHEDPPDDEDPNAPNQEPPPETSIVELCTCDIDLVPCHVRGDRDFKGHGPLVCFEAELRVDREHNRVELRIYMKAEEWDDGPMEDYTTARSWSPWYPLYPPPGTQIVGLADGEETHFQHTYLDDDHEDDVFRFGGHRLVGRLVYTGDTFGSESGTDTGVTACFNCIRVVVTEE